MNLLALQRDLWSTPFFDAAARGQLLILTCNDCGGFSAPQARRCAICSSQDVEWVESAGIADIVSWASPHRRESGGGTVASYVIALVELSEGPWMHVQVPTDRTIHTGQRVTVVFESVDGGESLPVLAAS